MNKRKVMVFGVFDRLHPGHHYFLEHARKMGDELVVVVARDSSVVFLKSRQSVQKEAERLESLNDLFYVDHSVIGDETLGTYEVLKEYEPNLICVGYDQEILEKDLKERMERGEVGTVEIIKIDAFHPEEYHSSIRP
jgi:FAD synthetase